MFKKELMSHIKFDYKELNNLDISIDGEIIDDTLYNLLTPYLAHKNTIDQENRVISFYTREGSRQQKLLPFYIGLSNYYKAFNEIKLEYSETELENKSLETELNLIIDNLPARFEYLNKTWITKELSVDIEKNNKIHLYIESIERNSRRIAPQIQDILPSLKKYINNYSSLEKSINDTQINLNTFLEENDEFLKFKQIRDSSESKIGIEEILKFGNTINISPSAGVLLFTNKTKYRKLIKSTYINGKPITETFSIAEIKFKTTGEISVSKETNQPIIYFCSSEYYAGWQEIVDEIGVDYINTLVIDDFDLILYKEIRSDFEYFREFSESIKKAQKANKLKDVYFLDEDTNFHNSIYLEKFNLDYYPWLLNYMERNSLIGRNVNENSHKTISIHDEFGSRFWLKFKPLVVHLNSLSKTENNLESKAKILTLLRSGYDFLYRATSFYHPQLKHQLMKYIDELIDFNKKHESASLKDKIISLKQVVESDLFKNNKLKEVLSILLNQSSGSSVVISKNQNSGDIHEARKYLRQKTGLDEIDFVSLDNLNSSKLKRYDNAFFLHFSGKFTRSLFLSKLCKNQFVILNDKSETGYYKSCFYKYVPRIIELSDFDNKLILLNIEDQERLVDRNRIEYDLSLYLEYKFSGDEDYNLLSEEENNLPFENEDKIDEQDFSYVIEKLLQEKEKKDSFKLNDVNEFASYLILFEKSFVRVPKWKNFHILTDLDSHETNDRKVKVSELKIGDKVFVMEGFNDDFNDLLTFLKDEYKELKKHFDVANSWRLDLISQYEIEGGFYSKLNSFLKKEGVVVSDPTVEKWVSGITIVPDSLPQLIEIFKKQESSFSSRFDSEKILESTRWLAKFRTSLHKEIFQYHVYKKYGMYNEIKNLKLKNLIEKMDDIVSIEEVLMIQKQ